MSRCLPDTWIAALLAEAAADAGIRLEHCALFVVGRVSEDAAEAAYLSPSAHLSATQREVIAAVDQDALRSLRRSHRLIISGAAFTPSAPTFEITLRHELEHYTYRDLSHQLATIDRYTTLAARDMAERGRRAGWLRLLVHPPLAFLRNYVLRGGMRDGTAGFVISAMNAYYVFLKFAKLWEQHERR